MRHLPALVVLAVLAGCDAPADTTPADPVTVDSVAVDPVNTDPRGLYRATLPCADCPGILTALWVREDGLFVLQETYLERDSVPFGRMGRWGVREGQVVLMVDSSIADRYMFTAAGLQRVDLDGTPFDTSLPMELMRAEGTLESTAMHLTGAYRYEHESHSFQPCGLDRELPLGMATTGLEMAMWYTEHGCTQDHPLFVELDGYLGSGPAMEGDGTDEYLYLTRVRRRLSGEACPPAIPLP